MYFSLWLENLTEISNRLFWGDALAATPLAEELNAPILLTGKNKLNSTTKSEIERLGAQNIYLIGGESVLSDNLSAEISGRTYRISGSSREKTALAIAKKINELNPVKTIAVVNGTTGLADAVSIASVAAEKDMAIILSNPKSGISASKDFINSTGIEKSYVIGGDKAVSDYVMSSLPGAERVSGSNRNDTNAKVIEKFYTSSSLNNIYVAKNGSGNTGQLIDALAVGVLAAKNSSPVLIVSNSLSASQRNVVRSKEIGIVTRVGGNGNESAFEEVKELQGIKPAELKLPTNALTTWYIKYKGTGENGDKNNYYSYGDYYRISTNYIKGYDDPIKYKVTKIENNTYYLDFYYHHEYGDGLEKHKFIFNGNTLLDYIYKNGKYISNITLYKNITIPDYAYRDYYRDDDICLSIDENYMTIFGFKFKYELTDYRYPYYNDFIVKTVGHNPPLYLYMHQWGNKVEICFATADDYENSADNPWVPIATFSTSPLSTEILGDVNEIPPGSIIIY